MPKEIQAHGDKAVAAFKEAMEKGSVPVYRGRIMLLGQDRAGKTSLKKSLLGIPFDPEEESTIGVQVDPAKCEVEIDQVKNWRCTGQKYLDVSEFREDIAKITASRLKNLEQEKNDPLRQHDIIILPTMEVFIYCNNFITQKLHLACLVLCSSPCKQPIGSNPELSFDLRQTMPNFIFDKKP